MPAPFVCVQSSSSDSSNGISSPECATVVSARPCIHSQNRCISRDSLTRQPEDCTSSSQYGFHGDSSNLSYDCINRILREAHFSSLQMRARRGLTWQWRQTTLLTFCSLPINAGTVATSTRPQTTHLGQGEGDDVWGVLQIQSKMAQPHLTMWCVKTISTFTCPWLRHCGLPCSIGVIVCMCVHAPCALYESDISVCVLGGGVCVDIFIGAIYRKSVAIMLANITINNFT